MRICQWGFDRRTRCYAGCGCHPRSKQILPGDHCIHPVPVSMPDRRYREPMYSFPNRIRRLLLSLHSMGNVHQPLSDYFPGLLLFQCNYSRDGGDRVREFALLPTGSVRYDCCCLFADFSCHLGRLLPLPGVRHSDRYR